MKKKSSKRFRKLLEICKDKNIETIENAIKKIKLNCTTKFDESIDISLALNLKKKKEEITLRTIVNLPNGNGKKLKVAVLCEENKAKEAKDAGADFAGRRAFWGSAAGKSVPRRRRSPPRPKEADSARL